MSTSEQEQTGVIYCYRHPTRETSLHCNRCGHPICPSCAIHTPTGYRCQACIRNQQKVFETAKPMDFVYAVAISGVIAFVGSLLVSRLGYFTLFLAPGVGIGLAEAVRWATGKRRSPKLFKIVVITSVVGALPLFLVSLLGLLFSLGSGIQGIFRLWGPLWLGYYIVTMTTTAYYRLSGNTFRWRR